VWGSEFTSKAATLQGCPAETAAGLNVKSGLRDQVPSKKKLETAIKYLRKKTSGAAGIGLGTTNKYSRRTMGSAAGSGLGTMLNYVRVASGHGMGTTIKYLKRTTSAAVGSGLGTTINEHSIAMHNERRRGQWHGHRDQVPVTHNDWHRGQRPGATIKYLRRSASAADANNCLGNTIKYLVNHNFGAGSNLAKAQLQKKLGTNTDESPCSAAAFVVKTKPHTGARSSVPLCVGSELARCFHDKDRRKETQGR
jgi:hypothetical protein